jgi:hypothetical protein
MRFESFFSLMQMMIEEALRGNAEELCALMRIGKG